MLTDRTRAIIVVHLGGYPADMDPIMELARSRGIKVIEDCAQAHGARYRGRSVGSIGDIGAWSFCQDKIMTTGGEGGMVTVDDDHLWKAMWSYKDHGKSWDAVQEREHPPGFRWLHESFGTNWRMLEMQAAIGRIQLRRMPQWTAARNANARRIHDALLQLAGDTGPIRLAPFVTSDSGADVHAYYRYYCYVRPRISGLDGTGKGLRRRSMRRACPVSTALVPRSTARKRSRSPGWPRRSGCRARWNSAKRVWRSSFIQH